MLYYSSHQKNSIPFAKLLCFKLYLVEGTIRLETKGTKGKPKGFVKLFSIQSVFLLKRWSGML